MREEDVPQDESPFYQGHLRACYAVGPDGKYVLATSTGWTPERIATAQALADLENRVEAARLEVIAGRASPLAYHMAARQMTPRLLARNARIFLWRVRGHLAPAGFTRLTPKLLERYADCLSLTIEDLRRVPPEARRVFTDADLGCAEAMPGGEA